MSPATVGGQVFCVFYAMFGIPLFLIVAGEVGIKIHKGSHFLVKKLGCLANKPRTQSVVESVIIVPIGIILLVLIPAAVFYALESWTYWEGIYYSVITLTTIGFGDYVAGEFPPQSANSVYACCNSTPAKK